jgi:hypothetical protein
MAAIIAAQAGWEISDYSLETASEEPHLQTPHLPQLKHSSPDPALSDRNTSPAVLDNPAFIAGAEGEAHAEIRLAATPQSS